MSPRVPLRKIGTNRGGLSQSPPFFLCRIRLDVPALRRVIACRAASGTREACKKIYSAAWRKFGAGCLPVFTWRGRPIRIGWKNTAAAIVHNSASAISLPMLDMPG